MEVILQKGLPYDPFDRPRLPGIAPLGELPWLFRDEAFAAQMAQRDRAVAERRDDVIALLPEGQAGADELLSRVLEDVYGDPQAAQVARPDGVRVPVKRDDPMGTLARLVQEDLCLMTRRGDEHVLAGAALCFPASWTLREKLGRPMVSIHLPVEEYDATLARRVQRLLDGVRDGAPLWRSNALWYDDPALYQPRGENAPRPETPEATTCGYLRSERQCLMRLPQSNAVAFSIHTYVLARENVVT